MESVTVGGDSLEAVILPGRGARLHRLRAFGHDILRTPDEAASYDREPFFWGSYVMAPWCNRVRPGPVAVGARRVDLAATFADGSAIHGQVHDRPWHTDSAGAFRVTGGGDGWPWEYELTEHVSVVGTVLAIDLALVNQSSDRMPAGVGLHPWFRRPVRVAIHGSQVYRSNLASPVRPEPARGGLDLDRLRELPVNLDATWTDFGSPAVELEWPDSGVRAVMAIAARQVHVAAAGPADLDAVAVEPQTHAPDGLRRLLNDEPGALTWLSPGDELRLAVEIEFSREAR